MLSDFTTNEPWFCHVLFFFHPAARIRLELVGEHFWMGRVCNVVYETTEFV